MMSILRIVAIEWDYYLLSRAENKDCVCVKKIDIDEIDSVLRPENSDFYGLEMNLKQIASLIKQRRRVVENNLGIVSN